MSSARNQPDWVDTSLPTLQCHFLTFPPVAHDAGGAPLGVGDQEPYSPATGFSLLERWGPWAGLVSILGACPRRAKPTPATPGHTGTHLAKDWAQGQPLLGSGLLGPSKPGPVRLTGKVEASFIKRGLKMSTDTPRGSSRQALVCLTMSQRSTRSAGGRSQSRWGDAG